MTSDRQPLSGRAFWYGSDLARSGDWIRRIGAREAGEIARALVGVKRRRLAPTEIAREDFPLGATADLLLSGQSRHQGGQRAAGAEFAGAAGTGDGGVPGGRPDT